MPKKEETSLKRLILQNFVWLAGLVMAILNLWLASRLAPLTENIIELNTRVSAQEQNLSGYKSQEKEILDQIVARINHISDRVDLLVSKLIK